MPHKGDSTFICRESHNNVVINHGHCWVRNESNVKARPQQWYSERKRNNKSNRRGDGRRGTRDINKTKILYWLDEIRVQLTLTTLRRSINSMKSILDSLRERKVQLSSAEELVLRYMTILD
ncbi:hypothetical protein YC2023_071061 [Brassica napus]